jgi:hypothetical protein
MVSPPSLQAIHRPGLAKGFIFGSAGIVLCLIAYFAWSGIAGAVHERRLSYSLIVEPRNTGETFDSDGRERFRPGDKFKISVLSESDGYVFVFSESPDQAGSPEYYALLPTPQVNDGSTMTWAGQTLVSARNTFHGGPATERLWIIWSREPLDVVERSVRISTANGVVAGDYAEKLNDFLRTYGSNKPIIEVDAQAHVSVLRSKGNLIVHPLALKHR